MNNTQDLSEFGHKERQKAATLLKLYATNNDNSSLDGGVKVEFNPMSGLVFLVDEDFNVAMEHDGKLEDCVTCPNCGNEEIKPEFKEYVGDSECCLEYFKERYED